MKYYLFFSLIILTHCLLGQTPTIGLTYNSDSVAEGYVLFSPDLHGEVYLIDNCGRTINQWSFDEPPGLTSYLLENGNLLFAGKDSIYIRDWNNNPIWSYATTANGISQHHDIEPLPNGNILCLASETKTQFELTEAGRDAALLANNFKIDMVVELEPVGSNAANVVWEWHLWDHLIQEYDPAKLNYGVVADSPELVDLNFDNGFLSDWSHFNSIDYSPDYDQIIMSSRHLSELYIIDHGTTTIEAQGHTGGNSGKGGDLLWRWGNKQVYQQGTQAEQQLFKQHDAKWIPTGNIYERQVTVFNNDSDGSGTFSSIHRIVPPMNGAAYILSGNVFGPTNFDYTWNGNTVNPIINSDKKSGVQALANGGYLICDTEGGKFVEIDSTGARVWQYSNPYDASGISPQFTVFSSGDNAAFRATKYSASYPGITAQTISVGSIIEDQNSISNTCFSVSLENLTTTSIAVVNPIRDYTLELSKEITNGTITLHDQHGVLLTSWNASNQKSFPFQVNLSDGIYLLTISTQKEFLVKRIVISSGK